MARVSDEAIISALIECGSVVPAAAKCGISARTIYKRMDDRDFKELYQKAKADVLRSAVNNLNGKLITAIEATTSIINDETVNAAVRLQAAQTIFSYASKFSDRLGMAEAELKRIIDTDAFHIGW